MAPQITPQKLKGGKEKEKLKKIKDITTINGENFNKFTQPDAYQVAIWSKRNKVSIDNSISLNEKAKILLGSVCSISTEGKDYSLITICGDTEPIDNENIIDMALYDATKSEPTNLDDKFSNVDDPIFNLDDDIPKSYAKYNKLQAAAAEPDYIAFAASLRENIFSRTTSTAAASGVTTLRDGATTKSVPQMQPTPTTTTSDY